ncbi:MAG: tyrosine--tRNA ligase [Lactobacillales bacterium]|nr:tyrosine--tRNA ligase [Lactobacillales bacterium]
MKELKERGLVYQSTDEKELSKALGEGNIKMYIGFDPTANSLHVGNLVPILLLRRFQLAGHFPIALVGGGTGLIGDPSFKDDERQLNSIETVQSNVLSLKEQLARFVDFDDKINPAMMVNNHDWYKDTLFIDFLRDIGKYFTINYMMSKESVRRRIETGISYTEFAYQLLQGYDFYLLNEQYGISLQVGGSDQWGNITAGIELLRKKANVVGHAFTVPLITDSTGKKFGKSEGNAIWLDSQKTSPYEFYQFWLNTADADAVRFLKLFTFLTLEEIANIEEKFLQAPHERLAQKTLAKEVTIIVHSQDAYEQALRISGLLFGNTDIKELSVAEIKQGLKDVPNFHMLADQDRNLVEVLVVSGIESSKRQAREDIVNGAIYVNGGRIQEVDYILTGRDQLNEEITVIRRGKKKYFLLSYD